MRSGLGNLYRAREAQIPPNSGSAASLESPGRQRRGEEEGKREDDADQWARTGSSSVAWDQDVSGSGKERARCWPRLFLGRCCEVGEERGEKGWAGENGRAGERAGAGREGRGGVGLRARIRWGEFWFVCFFPFSFIPKPFETLLKFLLNHLNFEFKNTQHNKQNAEA